MNWIYSELKKSNYGKTESNYIQNLEDLSDDVK
jgi:hypothetical protein